LAVSITNDGIIACLAEMVSEYEKQLYGAYFIDLLHVLSLLRVQ